MRRILMLFVAAVLLAASACQRAEPAVNNQTNTPPAGYPGPGDVEATQGSIITVVPTPSSASLATVTGYLMVDPASPRPVGGALLYLGEIIPEAAGTPFLAGFERTTSPRTLTDPNGRFVFTDVEPGPYTLILDKISESFMLGDPDKPGGDFIFDAQPSQILDLGQLVYIRMP
jgi:hypothetical protein